MIKWTKVYDRLPDKSDTFLCAVHINFNHFLLGEIDKKEVWPLFFEIHESSEVRWIDMDGQTVDKNIITHWAELPQYPNETP